MPKERRDKIVFPKSFLWGASTAAHQVEGGNHNQWSVWELENAQANAFKASHEYGKLEAWPRIKEEAESPDNYVSGKLGDHFHRYREDFDLLDEMNMNAYRFSIEWSRIEPEEGKWNAAAINHYKQYVRELKRREIEPIVTLVHFTLPIWFCDMGGFEKRRNVDYFLRYAEKIIDELGPYVRYVISFNEPEAYALVSYLAGLWPPNDRSPFRTWRVLNNMAFAHKRLAGKLHAASRRYTVSFTKNYIDFIPGDNAWLTRFSAAIARYLIDDYMIKKFVHDSDFIGINYYMTMRFYGYRIHNPEKRVSDVGWDLQPANLEHVLVRVSKKYGLPIIVTENGLADGSDQHRRWWLEETLTAMSRAIKQGVRLHGYLHWSLMDNFEWDKGKWPRFGLVEVDYASGKRRLRPSAVWFGKVIGRLRGLKDGSGR